MIFYILKSFTIFKNPLRVLYHYFRCTSPQHKTIYLKNGNKILLSDHPHDIITLFVIFVRQDYGKIAHNSTVIDIGANIGLFSLYAAEAGAKQIYAYEPNKNAYEVLRKNISLNGWDTKIIPYNRALSDIENETVSISYESSPYNQIQPEASAKISENKVKTVTLQSILKENSIDMIDLLKIDCEGCEYAAIFNSPGTVFDSIMEIRMEYHPGPIDKLILHLANLGFKPITMNKDHAVLWVKKFQQ